MDSKLQTCLSMILTKHSFLLCFVFVSNAFFLQHCDSQPLQGFSG